MACGEREKAMRQLKLGDRVKSRWERGRLGTITKAPDERGVAMATWEDGTEWWVDSNDVAKVRKGDDRTRKGNKCRQSATLIGRFTGRPKCRLPRRVSPSRR